MKWFVVCSLLAFGASAMSAVINVPGDQPTIQAGIDAASSGDMVVVGPGIYTESINYGGKAVYVKSSNGPYETVITGSNQDTLVFFGNNEGLGSVLEGFMLQGGRYAIRCADAGPTIRYNIMDGQHIDNWAAVVFGGHGYANMGNSPAVFTNNTIVHSTNGGLSNFSTSAPTIRNNIIAFNAAYGIHQHSGPLADFGYDDIYGNFGSNYIGGIDSTMGPGEISADPLFLDEAGGNYMLDQTSPCIDAGDPDPQYNDPDGSRADMGAVWTALDQPYAIGFNMFPDTMTNVLSLTPNFNWNCFDSTTGQAAYELEVGTDPDWTVAEMWSPGQIVSSDSSVVYGGASLIVGETYWVRLRLNNGTVWGSWRFWFFTLNTPPTVPIPLIPVEGGSSGNYPFRLTVFSSEDAQGDQLLYDYEIYADSPLTVPVFTSYDVPGSQPYSYSGWVTGLDTSTVYFWRAKANDSFEESDWSQIEWFVSGNQSLPDSSTSVTLEPLPLSISWGGNIICGSTIQFQLRISNYTDSSVNGLSNGFVVYSPDSALWQPVTGMWSPWINWNAYLDGGQFVNYSGVTGSGSDTVGFGAFSLFGPGYQSGNSNVAFLINTEFGCDQAGKTICLDTSFYPPSGTWLWSTTTGTIIPSWDGPHCWTIINSCCIGMRGNVDYSPDGQVNIADITAFIDYLFTGGPPPYCEEEADVDGSGQWDVLDLVYLVSYLFQGGPPPLPCP